jgi:hydroxypyruvate reductase
MHPQALLFSLFQAAVERAQPSSVLPPHLPPPPVGRTVVIGAGKAAAAMAQAVEASWPAEAMLSGCVVTRYGHVPPRPPGIRARIEILEAAHPVPDSAGLTASVKMLEALSSLTADDLVLCLMSGGASSLLTLPAAGLDFEVKQRISRELLLCGAPIEEMNCVRKHLSAIKGGRLAIACAPAQLVTLAISDVPGDDLGVIGSGPTVPDPTTCNDALDILDRYRIEVPAPVRASLLRGIFETPKPTDPAFDRAEARVIAAPWQSLRAAAELACASGFPAHILGDAIQGESRDVARVHAGIALSIAQRCEPFSAPCILLSGGETTVSVNPQGQTAPPGRGGRAGEFSLGLAQALQGHPRIWGLAADTDGIDGVKENAGAYVQPDTLSRAKGLGLSIQKHLQRNDSYTFFAKLNHVVVTGPTYTNVNDFRAVLVL